MQNKKLVSNFFYNTLYQILVLIAPLITIPYVSRILGVTNIGIYQYCQSVATYFVLVGAVGTSLYGQREIAYLQDKSLERSCVFWEIELFRLCFSITATIIYTLLFAINGEYCIVYRVLIIEVLASGFDISWFFMGLEKFKITVIRNLAIKFSGVILVFIIVKNADDLVLYSICVTAPILIGNLSLWLSLKNNIVPIKNDFRTITKNIKKRVRFILILFLPQVAIEIYTVLDKTMIGILATNIDEVGYYSQAQRIVRLVLAIVTSLGTVMLPSMSALFAQGNKEQIVKHFKKAIQVAYILGFSLLFGLCAIAERFVPIFFGEGYDAVVDLLVIISPVIVIIASSNIITYQYLLPTNRQKDFTISIVTGALVNFILNIILIHYLNAVGASIATVIAEITVTGVQFWFVKKELPLRDCIHRAVRYALLGAIMYLVCRGVNSLLPMNEIWTVIIIICVGIISFGVELLITNDPIVRDLKSLLKDKKSNNHI